MGEIVAHEGCLGSRIRSLRLLMALQAVLSPTFLAPGTSFVEGNFSMDWAGQGSGDGLGMIQAHHIYVHFISIIITSAPPQIIRH